VFIIRQSLLVLNKNQSNLQQYSKFPPSAPGIHSSPPLPSVSSASFVAFAVVDWTVVIREVGEGTEVKTLGDGRGVPRGEKDGSSGGFVVRIWNRCVFCLRIQVL